MNEHQRETAFLRHLILYDETVERHNLEERITQVERNERCVQCAVWLMVWLTAFAAAGLCYAAIFLADFPQNKSQIIIRVFGGLGLGSLICVPTFVCFWMIHRRELDERREECRRLVTKLLEARLGRPCTKPLPGVVKERENVVNGSAAVASASENVMRPKALVGASRSPDCLPRPADGGGMARTISTNS